MTSFQVLCQWVLAWDFCHFGIYLFWFTAILSVFVFWSSAILSST